VRRIFPGGDQIIASIPDRGWDGHDLGLGVITRRIFV